MEQINKMLANFIEKKTKREKADRKKGEQGCLLSLLGKTTG